MTAPVHLAPGASFAGEFRIERALAEGGMGAVYIAEQISTGKRRALKVMHPSLVPDARSRERFVEEARIGGQIASEHVVDVIAAGVDAPSGIPWLCMELLEGADLEAVVRQRGPMSPGQTLELFEQVGHALGRAHARGIIHRDLKPDLFLAQARRKDGAEILKILDFGIARTVEANRTAATVTTAIGSPLWMAPEQAQSGAKLRPATDVWALGLIAFYVLSGRVYWRAANHPEFNLSALLVESMAHPIEPATVRARELGATALPPSFDAWFLRCMDRDPERRFRDADEAIAALRPALGAGATMPMAPHAIPTQPLPPASYGAPVTAHAVPPRGSTGAVVGVLVAVGLFAVLGVGGLGLGGAYVLRQRPSEAPAPAARAPVTVPAEEPAPPPPPVVETPPDLGALSELAVAPGPRGDVTIGSIDEESGAGLFDSNVVLRTLAARRRAVQTCYERQLRSAPALAGRLTVRFTIAPTGTVTGTRVTDDRVGSPAVAICVTGTVSRLRFNPGPEGGSVTYAIPMTFATEASPAPAPSAAPAPRGEPRVRTGSAGVSEARAPRAEPRVRTGNADVRGSLSREVIQRVIRRHQGQVRACYERGLSTRPDLEGRVTLAFVISPTGTVTSASIAHSTLEDSGVEQCIAAAARRWTFPAPDGGGIVAVNYPFVLSTES